MLTYHCGEEAARRTELRWVVLDVGLLVTGLIVFSSAQRFETSVRFVYEEAGKIARTVLDSVT